MRVTFPCKGCGRDITADYTRPGKTAQCQGCKLTQEIPGDAPPPQFNAGKPAGAPAGGGGGGGGGGGMAKKLVILVILAVVAIAAWKFGRGRFF
ncbi:MAG: hypothetical protein K8T20_14385 [Planctomycetes bacterium]|nr:hypothetical protein [Planctomycetota bacterium]